MGYGERLNQLLEKPVEAHIPEAKLDEFSTLQQEFAEKKVFLVPAAVSTASAVSTSTSERRSFNPRRSHSRTFSRKLPVPPPFLLRSKDLPMYSYYGELMAAIDENPVVVISAETGAGKTTQLPQFILAFESEKRKAATAAFGLNEKPIKVIVTQPRRIAAISVAQRVAQERGETIGKNSAVGYTVRFDEMRPRSDPSEGQIVFCTSGILLRIFQENPDLDDITHLILDEVHERDLNTDLLLILTRQLVMRRPDIKIILMSATADTELFARYFTVPQYLPQPPVISVPGRLFPVEATFLPDVVNLVKPLTSDRMLSKDTTTYIRRQLYGDSGSGAGDRNGPTRSNSYDIARNRTAILDDGRTDAVPIDLIEALIVHIVEKKSDGAILVFLPSWADISTLQSRLKDEDFFQKGFGDPTRYRIFPMHSSVPNADQREVFEKSPPGVRKIVLATNIAETSVTINDVVYVIDSAKIRVASYDPNSRVSSLNSVFASRSNLKQRMGRAGRCQPGEYYSLITKSKHQALPYSLPPELLRVDLQSTVLKIASLDLTAFLEQAPVPPSRSSIDEAVTSLRSLGAIGIVESVTLIGRVLSNFSVDPWVGRMVLLGLAMRCLDPILTIACLTGGGEGGAGGSVFSMRPEDRYVARRVIAATFSRDGNASDLITAANAFYAWREVIRTKGMTAAREFAFDNHLSFIAMQNLEKARQQLFAQLKSARLVDGRFSDRDERLGGAAANEHADNARLIRAIICSGMLPNVA
ncbi:P-loop containing nucleoside triphosphate hydrolase protein, partial [Zopfochytrium polystomum]